MLWEELNVCFILDLSDGSKDIKVSFDGERLDLCLTEIFQNNVDSSQNS